MAETGNLSLLLAFAYLAEFLMVGLASGAIASFIIQADLPTNWIAAAGLVGTAAERWLPIEYGPDLFGHSILACIAASCIIIFAVALGRLPFRKLF